MKEKTAEELFDDLQEIFAEINTLTVGIYYEQLKELVESISKIPFKQRYRYTLICKENIYKECKKIADYFGIKTVKSDYLQDYILIVLYKNEKLEGVLSERK